MSTSTERPARPDPALAALAQRFLANPLGPYDAELERFLLGFRAQPARGKHVLVRIEGRDAWTLARMGGRGEPVTLLGGRYEDLAEAERAVFRARWIELYGWDPQQPDAGGQR